MSPRPCLAVVIVLSLAFPGCERSTTPPPATSDPWLAAARSLGEEAMQLGPERCGDRLERAMAACVQASRLDLAEALARDWLDRYPQDARVLYFLGDSQRVLQDHEAARATLERFLTLSPHHVPARLTLALVLGALGDHEGSLRRLEEYSSAREISPQQRLQSLVPAARSLRRLGRLQEAADRLAEVLQADPYHGAALAEAAPVLSSLGQRELAKGVRAQHQWLTERGHFLSTQDESKEYLTGPLPEAGGSRALQAADRREFLAATSELERQVAARPGDRVLAVALARLWLRLHRPDDALRILATRADGWAADALGVHAEALELLGKRTEALAAWRQASAALQAAGGPETPIERAVEILWRTANAGLELQQDAGVVEQSLQALARLVPGDWRPECGLGQLALARGELQGARTLLEAAAQRRGGEPARLPVEIRRSLAEVQGLQGDLQAAARALMQLITAAPGDIESLRAFARVFAAQREVPEAAQVIARREELEVRLASRRQSILAFSAAPLTGSAAAARALANDLAATGERDAAIDLLFLAADLEPTSLDALRAAAALLRTPRETFVRLHTLRRILRISPDDAEAILALAQAHRELRLWRDEVERLARLHAGLQPNGEGEKLLQALQAER